MYKEIGTAVVDEELICLERTFQHHRPFCHRGSEEQHCHRPCFQENASVCSLFLRINGTIVCKVTGSRCYSRDLPQGGLEVPCTLKFQGSIKDIDKVKKNARGRPKYNVRLCLPRRES